MDAPHRRQLAVGSCGAVAQAAALALALTSGAAVAWADTPGDGEHRTVIRPAPSVERWVAPTAVIDRGAFDDALTELPEVLDDQPGMRVSRLGGPGSTATLSVRGSTAQQVRYYLDGIPLDGADGAPVDLGGLPLGPIASIAVFRGASPPIFDASAIGGVVSLSTRRFRRPRAEVEVGLGAFGTRSARAIAGRGGEGWDATFSVDYLGTDGDFGYLDDRGTAWTTADDRTVRRANNHIDHAALMGRATFQLAPGLRLSMLNLTTVSERGLPGLGVFQTKAASLAQARNLAGARLEAAVGPWELAVTPYLTWAWSALDDPLDEVGLGADRARDEGLVTGATAAARAPLDQGEGLRLIPLVSAAFRFERWRPHKLSGPAAGDPGADRGIASGAASLTLALPWAEARVTATGRLETTTDGDGGPSWSASVGLEPVAHLRVSLRGYGGLRLPTLFERHGDTGYILGNPALSPERAVGGELRAAVDLAAGLDLAGLWTAELSGFATSVSDLIRYVQNGQGVARPDNIAGARILGAEVATRADLFGHLRARAALTALDAVERSDVVARDGRQLPFRPRWQSSLRLEGYLGFDGGRALTELGARVELDHVSGSFLDAANLIEVPARTLLAVGAHARLWRDQLRVDLAIRNLTDDRVQDLSGFPLPGRHVMLSLRWTPEISQ